MLCHVIGISRWRREEEGRFSSSRDQHLPPADSSMSSYKRAPPQDKPAPNSLTSLTKRDSLQATVENNDSDSSQWNPVSKWKENVEVPGLTLFDIHREPRRTNEDHSSRVRVQLKVCSCCLEFYTCDDWKLISLFLFNIIFNIGAFS